MNKQEICVNLFLDCILWVMTSYRETLNLDRKTRFVVHTIHRQNAASMQCNIYNGGMGAKLANSYKASKPDFVCFLSQIQSIYYTNTKTDIKQLWKVNTKGM